MLVNRSYSFHAVQPDSSSLPLDLHDWQEVGEVGNVRRCTTKEKTFVYQQRSEEDLTNQVLIFNIKKNKKIEIK